MDGDPVGRVAGEVLFSWWRAMVDIRTERTRNEIENDWVEQGFEILFEDCDDQIWANEEQDELLFVSWVNCEVMIFKRDRTVDL